MISVNIFLDALLAEKQRKLLDALEDKLRLDMLNAAMEIPKTYAGLLEYIARLRSEIAEIRKDE
jgi:hypothetical protein